jgi:hypothetical protein
VRAYSWFGTNNVAGINGLVFEHISILKLPWIDSDASRRCGLWCIFQTLRLDYDENFGSFTCSVGGERWREMMLKEKVVLVRNTSYAPEDRASHEIINVRSKPINNLGSCQWPGTRNTQRAEIHTSWSSHKFN